MDTAANARSRLFAYAAWIALALGAIMVSRAVVGLDRGPDDFIYFWLAGHMWGQGLDPYSPAYAALVRTILPDAPLPVWLYPPHWWAICRFFALFDPKTAGMLWRLASGVMIMGGTWFLARTLFPGKTREAKLLAIASVGLAGAMDPTRALLVLGQSTAFVYLGLCLLVAGVARPSRPLAVIGILLISLKPQLGVPIILGLLPARRHWWPILLATGIGLALASPQLFAFGPIATVRGLLGNLSDYSGGPLPSADLNSPGNSTGMLNLLSHAFPDIPALAGVIAAAMAAILIGILTRRAAYPLLPVSAVVLLVPLHHYDMTLIVILSLMIARADARLGMVAFAATVLMLYPLHVDQLIHGGGHVFADASLSIVLVLLAMLAIRATLTDRRKPEPAYP